MGEQEQRFRALVLIENVDHPDDLKPFWGKWEEKDGVRDDNFVVIRVDEVASGTIVDEGFYMDGTSRYKYVVPIDASDEHEFATKLVDLQAVIGDGGYIILKVMTHFPLYPQNASGFITPSELDAGEKDHPFYKNKLVHEGRQDNSPGFNPWG